MELNQRHAPRSRGGSGNKGTVNGGVQTYAGSGHVIITKSCHILRVFSRLGTVFPTSYHIMGTSQTAWVLLSALPLPAV